jgi:TPR repeat protein
MFMPLSFLNRWFSWPHAPGRDLAAADDLSGPKEREAQFSLAKQLETGPDSSQVRARQLYRQAAEQGHSAAQFHLAQMHAQGKGGARDEAAALLWLRRAAEAGHGGAQYHLGVRLYRASKYNHGSEASELRIESLGWLQRAVAQSWQGAESACEFVLLAMTKGEAEEGKHRAHSAMVNSPPVLKTPVDSL